MEILRQITHVGHVLVRTSWTVGASPTPSRRFRDFDVSIADDWPRDIEAREIKKRGRLRKYMDHTKHTKSIGKLWLGLKPHTGVQIFEIC